MAVIRWLKTYRGSSLEEVEGRLGLGGLPTCAGSQRRAFCLLLGGRARNTNGWRAGRELEVSFETSLPPITPGMQVPICFFSLESHALLPGRLQDAGTMKAFAQAFRVADSGQGPPGREPALCSGAFPIAGPSGEACRVREQTEEAPPGKADTHLGS